MIRLSSVLPILLVLGIIVAACGGKKSTTQATPAPTAVRTAGTPATSGTPGAVKSGVAASQNAATLAAGSSVPAAGQTPGDAGVAVGAGGTPGGGNTAPGSPSQTPFYTFSTPSSGEPSSAAGEASTLVAPASTAVPAGPAGGAIAVGAASLVGGNVEVPVNLTGTGIPAFTGFNIRLRWSPSVFKFSSAPTTGSVLPESIFCVAALPDADGAGVVLACFALAEAETTSAGLLATVVLQPVGTGCSPLHLSTYGGADDGDQTTGTFTMDKTANVVLTVTVDGSADQSGQHC